MKKKLYISGPMSGIPDNNFPEFLEVEDQLKLAGYDVINPARNPPRHGVHARAFYMKLDLNNVMACDGVALLAGHHYSPGCQSEIRTALDTDKPIAMYHWWIELSESQQ